MESVHKKLLSGFGSRDAILTDFYSPERLNDLVNAVANSNSQFVPRGGGNSYGNIAIATKGQTISTLKLNRICDWAPDYSWIRVQSGIQIGRLLASLIEVDCSLPVVPGAASATIGGCIAMDVHGKNSYSVGSFGQHVTEIELITSSGIVQCSPTSNSDLFWKTVGGMGSTGVIYSATLSLLTNTSPMIQVNTNYAYSLEELLNLVRLKAIDNEFCYAWMDPMQEKSKFGRGMVWSANRVKSSQNFAIRPNKKSSLNLPRNPVSLGKVPSKVISQTLWTGFSQGVDKSMVEHELSFHFPFSKVKNWERIYGHAGFIEKHFVIPYVCAGDVITRILDARKKYNVGSFFVGLKCFGTSSKGVTSFFSEGISIAIQYSLTTGATLFTQDINELVSSTGGEEYLAKSQNEPSIPNILSSNQRTKLMTNLDFSYISTNALLSRMYLV